jgi:hypothetical protein
MHSFHLPYTERFGVIMQPAIPSRIPVKLHRKVCFLWTEDAILAEEILARKKLAGDVSGRLTDQILLIRPGRADAVITELQAMGQTPKVIHKLPSSAEVG